MDPHSRLSQFNKRTTQLGPSSSQRYPDAMPSLSSSQKSPLDKFTKRASTPSASSSLIRRPIATNSRVKQVEKSRKDMSILYVNDALQKKAQGSNEAFDELVNQFNIKKRKEDIGPLVAQLRIWLSALSYVVSRLERTHSALVEAIINLPWTTLDTVTVKSYTEFIGVLLSARPEYLSLVLTRIAQGFTFQYGMQVLDAASTEASSSPLTRRIVYDRLHLLLKHLLSLIPTLPSTLQPLLVRFFPHKRQGHIEQVTYIRNILRVSAYCPQLSDQILATIVDRAIQMDVEIQVEIEELEEEDGPGLNDDIFEIDPMDVLVGEDPQREDSDADLSDDDNDEDEGEEGDDFSDISSDADGGEIPTNVKHIRDMVKKLDAILTLVFEHFQRTYATVLSNKNETVTGADQNSLPDLPPLPPLSPRLSTASLPSLHTSLNPQLPSLTSPSKQSLPTAISAPRTSTPLSGNDETLKSLFRTQFHILLSIFDRIILPTFKSRYTQFLLFWYTSLDSEFADIFQGMLVERALFQSGPTGPSSNLGGDVSASSAAHVNTSAVTRVTAASYIGSFVSRAMFVDREGTRRVVSVLCEFMRVHLENVEQLLKDAVMSGSGIFGGGNGIGGVAGFEQITVFYAVAQAAFLVFCFRWRDLQEDEAGEVDEGGSGLGIGVGGMEDELGMVGGGEKKRKWMPELNVLHSVVNSALNPLRVCSSSVAMQFAKVANATAFMYCYPLIDPGKYKSLPASSQLSRSTPSADSSSTTSQTNLIHPAVLSKLANSELNTFFPFDPYRLPKSGTYIEGIYREWASVALDDDEDDEDEEEEDENEDLYHKQAGARSSSPLDLRSRNANTGSNKSGSGSDDDNNDDSSDSDGAKTIGMGGSGFLAIPGAKVNNEAGEEGDEELGSSLGAMSISPANHMPAFPVPRPTPSM